MPDSNETVRDDLSQRGEDILKSVSGTRATIDWQKSTPWWFFLSGFVRLGWRLSHVILAAIGVWLSYVGLWIVKRFFLDSGVQSPLLSESSMEFMGYSPMLRFWRDFANAPWNFSFAGIAGLALLFVWIVIVWGAIGGAICRRSIIELGARTTIGWGSAIKLVRSRLRAILESVGLPALAAVGLCIVPLLLGLIARLGAFGEVVASLGVALTFLLAIPIAWLLLLATVGFPFMVAAIVSEKDSDAFDGLSRSAAYLFQRPVTVILCAFVAGLIISLITSFVSTAFVAGQVIYGKTYFAGAGISSTGEFSTGFARGVVDFARSVIALIISGLAVAMFWSATAAIYLIVRREVDHTEYDDLDLQEVGSPLALPSSDYQDNAVLRLQKESEPTKQNPPPAEVQPAEALNGPASSENGTSVEPTPPSSGS